MSKPATKSDWKTVDPPEAREQLGYEYVFDDAEANRLRNGFIPEAMEDKWFVYFDQGWLYLHRSWTGTMIYWLKLDDCSAGVRVVESWVNRDSEQYPETDITYDRQLLDFLLRALLLGQDVEFPMRLSDTVGEPGLFQHHVVGQNHPEKIFPDGGSSDDADI